MSHTIVLDGRKLHVRAVLDSSQDLVDLIEGLEQARQKYWDATKQPSKLEQPKETT